MPFASNLHENNSNKWKLKIMSSSMRNKSTTKFFLMATFLPSETKSFAKILNPSPKTIPPKSKSMSLQISIKELLEYPNTSRISKIFSNNSNYPPNKLKSWKNALKSKPNNIKSCFSIPSMKSERKKSHSDKTTKVL